MILYLSAVTYPKKGRVEWKMRPAQISDKGRPCKCPHFLDQYQNPMAGPACLNSRPVTCATTKHTHLEHWK